MSTRLTTEVMTEDPGSAESQVHFSVLSAVKWRSGRNFRRTGGREEGRPARDVHRDCRHPGWGRPRSLESTPTVSVVLPFVTHHPKPRPTHTPRGFKDEPEEHRGVPVPQERTCPVSILVPHVTREESTTDPVSGTQPSRPSLTPGTVSSYGHPSSGRRQGETRPSVTLSVSHSRVTFIPIRARTEKKKERKMSLLRSNPTPEIEFLSSDFTDLPKLFPEYRQGSEYPIETGSRPDTGSHLQGTPLL